MTKETEGWKEGKKREGKKGLACVACDEGLTVEAEEGCPTSKPR